MATKKSSLVKLFGALGLCLGVAGGLAAQPQLVVTVTGTLGPILPGGTGEITNAGKFLSGVTASGPSGFDYCLISYTGGTTAAKAKLYFTGTGAGNNVTVPAQTIPQSYIVNPGSGYSDTNPPTTGSVATGSANSVCTGTAQLQNVVVDDPLGINGGQFTATTLVDPVGLAFGQTNYNAGLTLTTPGFPEALTCTAAVSVTVPAPGAGDDVINSSCTFKAGGGVAFTSKIAFPGGTVPAAVPMAFQQVGLDSGNSNTTYIMPPGSTFNGDLTVMGITATSTIVATCPGTGANPCPAETLSTNTLSFTAPYASGTTAPQQVTVNTNPQENEPYALTTSASWLVLNQSGGTTGATGGPFNVSANTTGLSPGSYTGTVCAYTAASNSTASSCANGTGSTPVVTVNLTVVPPLSVTTTTLPNGEVGAAYSAPALAATGGVPPYSNWTVSSGSLPPGLTLNSSTGVISGNPTTAAGSPFSFNVTVKDSAGSTSAPKQLSIIIIAGPAVTTNSLPGGEVGAPYSQTLAANGGTGTYTNWAVTSGSLPPGLTLTAATGAISGTPGTVTGSPFNFSVTVTDSAGATSSAKSLSITIAAGPTVTTNSLPGGEVGASYSQPLAATGGTGTYTNWAVSSGSLPPGLSLSSGGTISGTPTTTTGSPFNFSVTVTDNAGSTSPAKSLSITIIAGPTVTTSSLPGGEVSVGYNQPLAASGGTGTYSNWTVSSGSLPPGLSLSSAGTISGMPTTTTGSPFSFSVTVKDSAGSTSPAQALSIVVIAGPSVTTTSLPNGAVGVAYNQPLAVSGGTAPYTWSVASGSLPPGLSLSSSGTISGTPSTSIGSPFSFSVTVKDNAGVTSSAQPLSIGVGNGVTITTTSLPGGEVGAPYSQNLGATGGVQPYGNWTVSSGSLPPGLTLNSSTGVIGGTPTTTTGSPFSFSVTVMDHNGNTSAAQPLSIAIIAAPTITTNSLPSGQVAVAYSQTLKATGGTPPYVLWTVSSGSLPPGLTLNSSSGVISGNPTTGAGSPFSFTVTVKDSAGSTSAAQPLSIAVIVGPSITTTTLPSGEVGVAYNQTLAVSGGKAPYTWSVASGSLPPGLSLSSGGAISGTPTTATGSPFSFSVTVKDSTGSTSPAQPLSIAIIAGVTITTSSLPNGTVGVAYSQALAASGGTAPYSNWTVSSGSLPAGLSLNSSTGSISGTPTTAGSPSFSVTVKDSVGNTSPAKALSITIVAPLTITTASLPGGTVGVPYSQTLAASGGAPPYSNWTVTSGSLPPGLTLTAATGVISGKPTTATGSPFTFSLTVSDSAKSTSPPKSLSLAVGTAVLQIGSPSNYFFTLANTAAPAAGTFTIVASDGSALPFTVTASPTNFNWLAFTPTSGTTPATIKLTANPAGLIPGIYVAPLMVTSGSLSLTIQAQLTITGSNLAASPSMLTFSYTPGVAITPQTVTVTTASGSGSVALASVTTDSAWLTVSSASSTPATLQVSVNPGALKPGTYTGDVLVKGVGSPATSLQIPVTITVNAAAQLTAAPATLTFNYQTGGAAPASQSFAVTASGNAAVNFTVTSPGNWLQLSPLTGTTPGSVLVTANPTGLAPGTFGGTITVTAPGANPASVAVTLTITGPPQINVAPGQLTFVAPVGGPLPGPQTLALTSTGAPLAFTAAAGSTWMAVTPTSGTTPATVAVSVNPAGLANGTYNGTVNITQAGSAVPQLILVTLHVGGTGPTVTTPSIAGVINAASGAIGTVAPGMAISIFGQALGPLVGVPWTAPTGDGTAATTLGGTQVLFDGTAVPLLYAAATQVNALVPFELAGKDSTVLTVSFNGQTSVGMTLPVVEAEPGLFAADATGKGQGAILNQDYSVNSASQPAAAGSTVMLFGTGGGVTIPPSIDGGLNPIPGPDVPLGALALTATATVGGEPAPAVPYAGPAPGLVAGIFQINVTIPNDAPSGSLPVVVTLSCATQSPLLCFTASSQTTVTVAVQ